VYKRQPSNSGASAKMSDPFFYKPYEPSAKAASSDDVVKPEEKKVGITPAKPAVGALLGGFKKK
jgi:ATP-dependent RNA helicase RhlE